MKGFVLISAVLVHCSWSYASPGPESSKAFAYVDTSGNRYECVYKPESQLGATTHKTPSLNKFNDISPGYHNWQVKRFLRIPPFRRFGPSGPSFHFLPPLPPLPPLEPLHPFKPLAPLPPLPPLRPLRRQLFPGPPFFPRDIFGNIENQQRAIFEAAQNPFNGFNAFPYIPNFDFRFPSFHDQYGMSGSNSAFAAGAVGPGYRRQVAAIDPVNPMMPNVDTHYYPQANPLGKGNDFYSVSSSSYSSSVNDNGQVQSQRGAETVVNDRGQITKYSVHS